MVVSCYHVWGFSLLSTIANEAFLSFSFPSTIAILAFLSFSFPSTIANDAFLSFSFLSKITILAFPPFSLLLQVTHPAMLGGRRHLVLTVGVRGAGTSVLKPPHHTGASEGPAGMRHQPASVWVGPHPSWVQRPQWEPQLWVGLLQISLA